jgi:hypothetical protein
VGRHDDPSKDSDKDGLVELDPADLARLAKEPEGGKHSAGDEDNPDVDEE